MSCAELDEFLDAYVDGELEHAGSLTEHDVARHLTQCQSCLEHVIIVRHLKLKLSRLHAKPAEDGPPRLLSRVVHSAWVESSNDERPSADTAQGMAFREISAETSWLEER